MRDLVRIKLNYYEKGNNRVIALCIGGCGSPLDVQLMHYCLRVTLNRIIGDEKWCHYPGRDIRILGYRFADSPSVYPDDSIIFLIREEYVSFSKLLRVIDNSRSLFEKISEHS